MKSGGSPTNQVLSAYSHRKESTPKSKTKKKSYDQE